ncbi:hypothetical protein NDU88_001312 [Pleurodeles waltl]|uniref:Uncharacterized protein n=1 Tax=Pleurodeles waltl TaxID=8319 RepID=A0AAV7NIM5_PLEWA|nr:hypothetical protein NDU88_001312 [Pleurodeles waltl]
MPIRLAFQEKTILSVRSKARVLDCTYGTYSAHCRRPLNSLRISNSRTGFLRPAKRKTTSKSIDLAMIPAKRELVMHWKAPGGLRVAMWCEELITCTGLEGAVQFRDLKREWRLLKE